MSKKEKIPTIKSLDEFCIRNNITEDVILKYVDELYKDKYVLNEALSQIILKFLFKKYDFLNEDIIKRGIIEFVEGF